MNKLCRRRERNGSNQCLGFSGALGRLGHCNGGGKIRATPQKRATKCFNYGRGDAPPVGFGDRRRDGPRNEVEGGNVNARETRMSRNKAVIQVISWVSLQLIATARAQEDHDSVTGRRLHPYVPNCGGSVWIQASSGWSDEVTAQCINNPRSDQGGGCSGR